MSACGRRRGRRGDAGPVDRARGGQSARARLVLRCAAGRVAPPRARARTAAPAGASRRGAADHAHRGERRPAGRRGATLEQPGRRHAGGQRTVGRGRCVGHRVPGGRAVRSRRSGRRRTWAARAEVAVARVDTATLGTRRLVHRLPGKVFRRDSDGAPARRVSASADRGRGGAQFARSAAGPAVRPLRQRVPRPTRRRRNSCSRASRARGW